MPRLTASNETFPRLPGSPVVDWRGHSAWRGQALKAFRDFDFLALPWGKLVKRHLAADGVTLVKRGGSSRLVFRVEHPARFGAKYDAPVYVKRYLIDTPRRRMGNLLSGGKADREFRRGWKAIELGLRTAEPGAWAVSRRASILSGGEKGAPPASFLLTLEARNEGTVLDYAKSGSAGEAFLPTLARFLAEMHARGFDHDDCSAENVLVAAGARFDATPASASALIENFVLLDVDHGRIAEGGVSAGRRALDLAQMLRSLRKAPLRAEAARRAFVDAYLEASSICEPAARRAFERAMNEYFVSRLGRKLI